VKLFVLVRLLSGMSFSHFGELWLAWSHGGALLPELRIDILVPSGGSRRGSVGHSELGAAASRKAVWWDLRLASLLTHLFFLWFLDRIAVLRYVDAAIVTDRVAWSVSLSETVMSPAKTAEPIEIRWDLDSGGPNKACTVGYSACW